MMSKGIDFVKKSRKQRVIDLWVICCTMTHTHTSIFPDFLLF